VKLPAIEREALLWSAALCAALQLIKRLDFQKLKQLSLFINCRAVQSTALQGSASRSMACNGFATATKKGKTRV
jgi:hypothetical protein